MIIHVHILYPTNGMIDLEAKILGKNYFLSLYTGSISKRKISVSGMETINEVWIISITYKNLVYYLSSAQDYHKSHEETWRKLTKSMNFYVFQ